VILLGYDHIKAKLFSSLLQFLLRNKFVYFWKKYNWISLTILDKYTWKALNSQFILNSKMSRSFQTKRLTKNKIYRQKNRINYAFEDYQHSK